MPTVRTLKTNSGKERGTLPGYLSGYDKQSEKATAGYYSVQLTGNNIKAELTAAPHSGIMPFAFPTSRQSRIQIDLARRIGGISTLQYVKVVDDYTIARWMQCTPDGGGWGDGEGNANYTVYFYASFSKPLKNYWVWNAAIPGTANRHGEVIESGYYQQRIAEAAVLKGVKEKEGKDLGFFTEFTTTDNEPVLMKAGISLTNAVGAKANFDSEIRNWDFDKVHANAVGRWNKTLSKIKISGVTAEEKKVFYTELYHIMIDPRSMQDINGNYTGADHLVHDSKQFTIAQRTKQ